MKISVSLCFFAAATASARSISSHAKLVVPDQNFDYGIEISPNNAINLDLTMSPDNSKSPDSEMRPVREMRPDPAMNPDHAMISDDFMSPDHSRRDIERKPDHTKSSGDVMNPDHAILDPSIEDNSLPTLLAKRAPESTETQAPAKAPVPLAHPYVFFEKLNDSYVPLYPKITVGENSFNFFSDHKLKKPVEFSFEKGVVKNENVSPPIYPGVYGVFLGFGDTKKDDLQFDSKMRISNKQLYKCNSNDGPLDLVVVTEDPLCDCKKMDVYLLPFNRTTNAPVAGLTMP